MVVHPSGVVARQVEIGVVGEVHHRVMVAAGGKVHRQHTAEEGIGDLRVDVAGVALLPIGGVQGEHGAVSLNGVRPPLFVEAHKAPVELIFALVCGEGIGMAVDGKLRAADAVGAPADGAAQAGVLPGVLIRRVIA